MGKKIVFGFPIVMLFLAYTKFVNPLDVQLILVLFFGLLILAAWIPPQAAKVRRSATQRANHVYHNNPIAQAHRRWDKYWAKRAKKRRMANRMYRQTELRDIAKIVDEQMSKNRSQIIQEIVNRYIDD